MADTRQFTDHNEIGGVNVYLEDKKLAESPEQNTVASTDYVLLKDEDDIPRKISKANLMSVVKDAIGELLKSNDLGTSVTNVPALNASAFGSATVTNLASVLGVGHIVLEAQIRNMEGYSNIYERDSTVGGLVIVGHWTIGWCLYQYGTSVTENILAGTLRSGITVNFQNNKLTIQSSISDSTAIYVLI